MSNSDNPEIKPEFDKVADPRTPLKEPELNHNLKPPDNAPIPTLGGEQIRAERQETAKQLQQRIDKDVQAQPHKKAKEKSEEERHIEEQRKAARDHDRREETKEMRKAEYLRKMREADQDPDRSDDLTR